jgi:hypothetical protein
MPFRLADGPASWVVPDAGVTATTISPLSTISPSYGTCGSYPGYSMAVYAKADLLPAPSPPAIPGIVGGPLHVQRHE